MLDNDVFNIIKDVQIISQLIILFSNFEDAFPNPLKLPGNMFITRVGGQ